jgi:predicted enzyme related to lactoylglutathione lyase
MTAAVPAVRLAYVNLFARDIEALSGFYIGLFGFSEIIGHRSPIYRCIDAGGIELGFNAGKAYELLELTRRKPATTPAPVTAYFTFEADSVEAVDMLAARAVVLGGSIIKPVYNTYYNAHQVVLADPEGNVFRINHRMGERAPVSADFFH